MSDAAKPIAVVQGADGPTIQKLFGDFADRWAASTRLVGVVEEPRMDGGRVCGPGVLRNIANGHTQPLFQQLGPGAVVCALDPAGAVLAGEAVRTQIIAGCDLVLLSKFGKMEAENGSGLMPAFIAAVEAGIPVLTSVSPKYERSWTNFAAPLFHWLPADTQSIEAWWSAVQPNAARLSDAPVHEPERDVCELFRWRHPRA